MYTSFLITLYFKILHLNPLRRSTSPEWLENSICWITSTVSYEDGKKPKDSIKRRNFLTIWTTVSFSVIAWLNIVSWNSEQTKMYVILDDMKTGKQLQAMLL
jgi:hypothetical protein